MFDSYISVSDDNVSKYTVYTWPGIPGIVVVGALPANHNKQGAAHDRNTTHPTQQRITRHR